jgi:hypothetical protein
MSNPLAEYLSALEARDARERAHEVYVNACMCSLLTTAYSLLTENRHQASRSHSRTSAPTCADITRRDQAYSQRLYQDDQGWRSQGQEHAHASGYSNTCSTHTAALRTSCDPEDPQQPRSRAQHSQHHPRSTPGLRHTAKAAHRPAREAQSAA